MVGDKLKTKHTVCYLDLTKPDSVGVTGEIEVILSAKQVRLLKNYNNATLDLTRGFVPHLKCLYYHLYVLFRYPACFG